MNEVICVGLSVADILVKGVKEVVINGTTSYADSIGMAIGGDALNQAAVLKKLGHQVGLLTLVGDDFPGHFLLEECAKRGIDTAGSSLTKKYPTSTSVVLIDPNGERSFISQKGGTVDEFTLADFDLGGIVPGVKVVTVGSLFSSPHFDSEVATLFKTAKRVGAATVADLVPNKGAAGFACMAAAMPLLDYVAPSELEAKMYTGKETPEEAADALLCMGAGTAIIKLGDKGALVATQKCKFTLPPYPTTAVDTTGAGDNFMAGFVAGLARGLPLENCLNIAAATASISITALGATTGVQSFAQVQQLVAKYSH